MYLAQVYLRILLNSGNTARNLAGIIVTPLNFNKSTL
jgi:hypothetical protein